MTGDGPSALAGVSDPAEEHRAAAAPYRMTPLEVAWGWVPGVLDEDAPVPGARRTGDAVAALEGAIRPALSRPPCLVQFSGGRDSSLVLAVATRLARREGLPEPVACTHVFPGLEETEEEHWQELVVGHLAVRDWERVTVTDELDLVGPTCAPSLLRHGLLWPSMVHGRHFDLARAAGGSLLDGEGGDEVLGGGRLAVVSALLSGRLRPGKAAAQNLALALAPPPARRAAARRLYRRRISAPWLRPDAWRRLEDAVADDFSGEPLDRRRSLERHGRLRLVALFLRNSAVLAAEHDVLDVKPLLDPGFLAALGATGGFLGFAGRTTTLTTVFNDLLPAEVLRRSTKARFNRAAFSVPSRAFVESWNGTGLDEELVDVDALRRSWADAEPNALSFGLLQAAWLATRDR